MFVGVDRFAVLSIAIAAFPVNHRQVRATGPTIPTVG
jgi:hypothetical protein